MDYWVFVLGLILLFIGLGIFYILVFKSYQVFSWFPREFSCFVYFILTGVDIVCVIGGVVLVCISFRPDILGWG
jgi:hypothetical protein